MEVDLSALLLHALVLQVDTNEPSRGNYNIPLEAPDLPVVNEDTEQNCADKNNNHGQNTPQEQSPIFHR